MRIYQKKFLHGMIITKEHYHGELVKSLKKTNIIEF